jgi:hypothetical protein
VGRRLFTLASVLSLVLLRMKVSDVKELGKPRKGKGK